MVIHLFRVHNIPVAHLPMTYIKAILSKVKDKRDKMGQSNVVYKIICSNCRKYYVEQTGRRLQTRLNEHEGNVRKHDKLSLI